MARQTHRMPYVYTSFSAKEPYHVVKEPHNVAKERNDVVERSCDGLQDRVTECLIFTRRFLQKSHIVLQKRHMML